MLKKLEIYKDNIKIETKDINDGISASLWLESYRYEKETGGITLNGVTIQSDRDTRANLIGARIKALENNQYALDWKTPSGFVTLSASQIIAIADAVSTHVEKCFKAEKQVLENINQYTYVDDLKSAFNTAYESL